MSAPNETDRGGKFTPGPWKAQRRTFNYGCYGHEIITPEWVQNLSTVQKVGPIAFIQTDDEQDRANAKLISAAPELLEALQEMIELVDDLDHENAVSSHFAAYRKAQAAIQLATE